MSKLTPMCFVVSLVLSSAMPIHADAASGPFAVVKTFPVGGVGGWDYMTVDSQGRRLFVPRSTHTMVLDEGSGKVLADIPGQGRNHGVALAPGLGRGFITDGKEGSVVLFDLKTYAVLGKVAAAADADGIIYDPSSAKVLVSCGDAGVLLPIAADVDPKSGKADAAVALGGKPEFLVADGAGKVYVNIEDKDEVAVVDTKAMKVVAKWPTAPGGAPVGMAMDAKHRLLFVGCRKPQKLIVMSADDGKLVADLPIGAGVDATRFDDGYAFASCRDGSLTVARETAAGKFEVVQTVKTPVGARTMDVDPATHEVFLPTAEFGEQALKQVRPVPKPDSFKIVVVGRTKN